MTKINSKTTITTESPPLGSARASRATASPARTDGAHAIANFPEKWTSIISQRQIDCGEAPQSAREARALPRLNRQAINLFAAACSIALLGCQAVNYVPEVTAEMTATSKKQNQQMDLVTLNKGRRLFVNRCLECHTLPAIWKYSREDWPEIVNDMSHRASLKPAEREAIIAYILAVKTGKE